MISPWIVPRTEVPPQHEITRLHIFPWRHWAGEVLPWSKMPCPQKRGGGVAWTDSPEPSEWPRPPRECHCHYCYCLPHCRCCHQGIITNSILFCQLFIIKDLCKKVFKTHNQGTIDKESFIRPPEKICDVFLQENANIKNCNEWSNLLLSSKTSFPALAGPTEILLDVFLLRFPLDASSAVGDCPSPLPDVVVWMSTGLVLSWKK